MPASLSSAVLRVGIVLFPNVTELDVACPYEIVERLPAARVYLVAPTLAPVRSEHGLTIVPDVTFDAVPPLDVICVPGGTGVSLAMEDEALLEFLRCQARDARYVTSISTGALVLGAAGLLQGYRATTQRLSLDLLPLFGARPVEQRIVIDRNRITCAGAAAGIDFGPVIASELCGEAPVDLVQRTAGARAPGWNGTTAPVRARVAIDSLEPGTTLVVKTRNSQYRFVILLDSRLVLVKGGAMFPEPTLVRLAGATTGGSTLKTGWILVGFRIEMWLDAVRIRSSRVRSVSIESIPAVWPRAGRARA